MCVCVCVWCGGGGGVHLREGWKQRSLPSPSSLQTRELAVHRNAPPACTAWRTRGCRLVGWQLTLALPATAAPALLVVMLTALVAAWSMPTMRYPVTTAARGAAAERAKAWGCRSTETSPPARFPARLPSRLGCHQALPQGWPCPQLPSACTLPVLPVLPAALMRLRSSHAARRPMCPPGPLRKPSGHPREQVELMGDGLTSTSSLPPERVTVGATPRLHGVLHERGGWAGMQQEAERTCAARRPSGSVQ